MFTVLVFDGDTVLETAKLAILERLEFEKLFAHRLLSGTGEEIFIWKIFRIFTKTKMSYALYRRNYEIFLYPVVKIKIILFDS